MFSLLSDFFHWLPAYFFPELCFDCGAEGAYVCQKCRLKVKCLLFKPISLICPICQRLSFGGWTHKQCLISPSGGQSRYGLDRLISFYEYDGWAKKIIKNVKFKKSKIYRALSWLSSDFASALSAPPISLNPLNSPIRQLANSAVLLPVPLHWYRQFKRGFNQSSLIAKELSRGLNIPINEKILKRIRHTDPQTLVDRTSRLKNLRGCFSVGPGFFSEKSVGTPEPLPKHSMSRERIVPKRRMLSWVGSANLPKFPNSPKYPKDFVFILIDDVWTTGATLSECCRVLKRAGAQRVWALTLLRA